MKNIIFVAGLALAVAYPAYSAEEKKPETKKVCVDVQGKDGKPVMDPKTNKPKQDCKEVKVHKKHEGTKVEDAKKK
jgi:azurin